MLDQDSQQLYDRIVEIYKKEGRPITLTQVYEKSGWQADKFKRIVKYLENNGYIRRTDVFQKYVPLKFGEPVQKEVRDNSWWKTSDKTVCMYCGHKLPEHYEHCPHAKKELRK